MLTPRGPHVGGAEVTEPVESIEEVEVKVLGLNSEGSGR